MTIADAPTIDGLDEQQFRDYLQYKRETAREHQMRAQPFIDAYHLTPCFDTYMAVRDQYPWAPEYRPRAVRDIILDWKRRDSEDRAAKAARETEAEVAELIRWNEQLDREDIFLDAEWDQVTAIYHDTDQAIAEVTRSHKSKRTRYVACACNYCSPHLSHGPDGGSNPAEQSKVDILASWLLRGDEVDQIQPLEPLVEDVLDLDTLAQLYGPPKSGKSFVALDIACHVAAGLDWHGHRVTNPGPVLYVAAEGAAGMRVRRRAWQLEHSDANLDRLLVMPAL